MNDEEKEIKNENIKEIDEMTSINKIEKEINEPAKTKNNINLEELWDTNSKYKINYTKYLDIINKGRKYNESTNEFLCNLLLMPQKILLSDKISSLNVLSNFYKKRGEKYLLYSIIYKFDKCLESLLSLDPALVINVFVRGMDCLQSQGNYIYAYKYLTKIQKILEKNSSIIAKKNYNIENVENFCEEINANYIKNIIIYRKKLTDDESIKEEDIQVIKKIIDLLIEEKYEINENEYLFAINKRWIIKTKSFIENLIKAKKDDIQNFYEESFDPEYIYESYFDMKNEDKDKVKDKRKKANKPRLFFPFPGLINNFEITAFKDFWNDSINLDENCFIKKGKKINEDYYLINEKDWKLLSDMFGSTNEIKRKKNNLDLLKLKFILFDRRISVDNGNIHLLKQKYIQINKNLYMKELKEKIIRVSNEAINIEEEKRKKRIEEETEKKIKSEEKEREKEKEKQEKENKKKGQNIEKNEDNNKTNGDKKGKATKKEGKKKIEKIENEKEKEKKENVVNKEDKEKIEKPENKQKFKGNEEKEEKENSKSTEKDTILKNDNKKDEEKKGNKEYQETSEKMKESAGGEGEKERDGGEENQGKSDEILYNEIKKEIKENKQESEKNDKERVEDKIEKEKGEEQNKNFEKENEKKYGENDEKLVREENFKINKDNKKEFKVSFYTLDKNKKEILVESTYSFKSSIVNYNSLFINELSKEELADEKPLTNILNLYKHESQLLIVEIYRGENDKFLYDLKNIMNTDFICEICSKKINNLQKRYKCDLCNYSLFCSEKCSKESTIHFQIDRQLYYLKEKIFVLSELLTTKLEDLLSGNSKHGRVGLGNMGNTCYMNSALQCLSNTEDLTKYFIFESFKGEINNGSSLSSKGFISKAYYDLIDTLWNENCTAIVPKHFRSVFCKKTRLFMNNEQQDSQEFLIALLDNLHEDLNRITNKKYMELEEQKKGESDEEASQRWWNYYISRENSIIVDLFHGQYKSTIKCLKCENTSISYDTYLSLGLPIPTQKNHFQFKLLTENLNFIDLNIKLNENIQIKDIIKQSINFLNIKKYKEYLIKQKKDNNEKINNDKDFEVPMNILYNNIEIIECNDNFKMINIHKTSFENIINDKKGKDNMSKDLFDNIKLSNFYKNNNNSELILFEKNINFNLNNMINTYIYPITTKKIEGILFSSNKDIILSYPIIISIKMDNSLEDLESLIYQKFKPFLKSDSKNKEPNLEICFPHFTKEWGKFKCSENICPICQKKYDNSKKYCQISNKKILISELIKNQTKGRPLIFFAKSQKYKKYCEFYSGIPLFNEKSSADIKGSRNNLSIYDAFDLFNKEEYLEGDNQWYCNRCKTHQNAAKKIEIYKTPLYLIVQLKRFKNRNNIVRFILGSKNSTYIDYKEVLNLKEFVVGPDNNKSIYNLYAITIHREFMNGGHYYAFCKNKNVWLTFDDEKVSYCENPVSKDAYLLFYKRKKVD